MLRQRYIFSSAYKISRNSLCFPSKLAPLLRLNSTDTKFDFKNLVEMQEKICSIRGSSPLFGTKSKVIEEKHGGKSNIFEWTSYQDFAHQVNNFRKVLLHHNIAKNDKVAIISNNRVEWAVAMYACNSLQAALVPMYEVQPEKDWKYILNDSDSKLVIVANYRIYDAIKDFIRKEVPKLEKVIILDSEPGDPHGYQRWMAKAEREKEVTISSSDISQTQTAVIIYTSGTTGNPKGVELSHCNIVTNILDIKALWQHSLDSKVKSLAFLPWAHIYGQTAELHLGLAIGSCMAIVTREEILPSFSLIQPTTLLAVPALFNRIYDGIMKKLNSGSPLKQKLFQMALSVSRSRNEKLARGETPSWTLSLQHAIYDKLVFSKIRQALGGKLEYMTSGGAACDVKVIQFFEDIGIPVCEGYGLTETSPIISSSTTDWSKKKLGCVGVILPSVRVKIINPETNLPVSNTESGEICVSGPSVMVGYYKNPKANEESFLYFNDDNNNSKDTTTGSTTTGTTATRYFRTGDLGTLIDNKFLKITGRIKEQFKLLNGKYVVPAPLEDLICRSRYIAQAYLSGSDQNFTAVLLVPDFIELKEYIVSHKIDLNESITENEQKGLSEYQKIIRNSHIIYLIRSELIPPSLEMKTFERPKRFELLVEPFSQDNQMLTPKMSLRRNTIITVYKDLLQQLYHNTGGHEMSAYP